MERYSQDDIERASRVASALDSPLRLRILILLCTGKHVVHELVGKLGKSQPLISQHLRVLKRAHLVSSTRQGREVAYSIAQPHVTNVILGLMDIAGYDPGAERAEQDEATVLELASRRPTDPSDSSHSASAGGAAAIIEPPEHTRPDIDPGLAPSTPRPPRD